MARLQTPQIINLLGVSTLPVQISSVQTLVTSFIIQAVGSNTDFIKIGNALGQFFEIAPGKDFEVNGDNLDNGTTAYVDLAQWYIVSVAGVQNANVVYLERY